MRFVYPITGAYRISNTNRVDGYANMASTAASHTTFPFSAIVNGDNRPCAHLQISSSLKSRTTQYISIPPQFRATLINSREAHQPTVPRRTQWIQQNGSRENPRLEVVMQHRNRYNRPQLPICIQQQDRRVCQLVELSLMHPTATCANE